MKLPPPMRRGGGVTNHTVCFKGGSRKCSVVATKILSPPPTPPGDKHSPVPYGEREQATNLDMVPSNSSPVGFAYIQSKSVGMNKKEYKITF